MKHLMSILVLLTSNSAFAQTYYAPAPGAGYNQVVQGAQQSMHDMDVRNQQNAAANAQMVQNLSNARMQQQQLEIQQRQLELQRQQQEMEQERSELPNVADRSSGKQDKSNSVRTSSKTSSSCELSCKEMADRGELKTGMNAGSCVAMLCTGGD